MSVNPISQANQILNGTYQMMQINASFLGGSISAQQAATQLAQLESQFTSFPNIYADLSSMANDVQNPGAYNTDFQQCCHDIFTDLRPTISSGLQAIKDDAANYVLNPSSASAKVLSSDSTDLLNFFTTQYNQFVPLGGVNYLAQILGLTSSQLSQLYSPPAGGLVAQLNTLATGIAQNPIPLNENITQAASILDQIRGLFPTNP